MNKEKIKKLTLADIISKKEQIQDSKKKLGEIYVPSLEGYIVVEKPDRELMADAHEYENGMDSNVHLVSNCIVEPNIKDKETMSELGVHTPKELLQTILSDGEIGTIAEKLMDLAGYTNNGIEMVKDLKN